MTFKEESQTTAKNSLNTHLFYFKPSVKLLSAWRKASQRMKKQYLPTNNRSFLNLLLCTYMLQAVLTAQICPYFTVLESIQILLAAFTNSVSRQWCIAVCCILPKETCLLQKGVYMIFQDILHKQTGTQLYKSSDAWEKKNAKNTA